LTGPKPVLDGLAAQHPDNYVLMTDGNYYVPAWNPRHPLACQCGCKTPEAHVILALKKVRPWPEGNLWDPAIEQIGFYKGLGVQAWDDVTGTFKFAMLAWDWNPTNPYFYPRSAKAMYAFTSVKLGTATDQQREFVASIGTKAENVSGFIKGSWDLWLAAEQSQWGTLAAAASLDWDEANRQSETMRWMNAYTVELMVAMHNEYVEASPMKRGEIKGRITLEVAAIVLPFTKPAQAAQLSKVAMLEKLKVTETVQGNQKLLDIVTRLIELAKGNKPVPPIQGLQASELPPLLAGAEVDGAGLRISGETAIGIGTATGTRARRAKVVAAMKNHLPNAGEFTVGHRMATYQKAVVSQMDDIPTPEQYADCLRIKDYLEIRTQKRITHVLLADEAPGPLVRLEGNIPKDWLRGHHWPPEYIQNRFKELGVDIPNVDDCPVQILSEFEHGKGGSATAIHRLMDKGLFPEDPAKLRLLYPEKQQLMDELLKFVKNHPNDDVKPYAKALRGWARERSIPFEQ
jgi:hypothetical protein